MLLLIGRKVIHGVTLLSAASLVVAAAAKEREGRRQPRRKGKGSRPTCVSPPFVFSTVDPSLIFPKAQIYSIIQSAHALADALASDRLAGVYKLRLRLENLGEYSDHSPPAEEDVMLRHP
jgi:hypothetical protein